MPMRRLWNAALGAVAQSAGVKCAGFGPALESQMLEQRAAEADVGGSRGKSSRPLTPLFAVEFFEGGVGFELSVLFRAR